MKDTFTMIVGGDAMEFSKEEFNFDPDIWLIDNQWESFIQVFERAQWQ